MLKKFLGKLPGMGGKSDSDKKTGSGSGGEMVATDAKSAAKLAKGAGKSGGGGFEDMAGAPDMSKMNMMQRMAYKQFLKMSPDKQRDVLKKAMTPENISKHKDEIIAQLEEAKASGMMSDDQYRLAKKKFNL